MKKFVGFFRDIIKNRKLIFKLAINDFRSKYAGSYLGVFWSFIQPFVTIAVYWFVFEKGLKAGARSDGTPFIVWLVCGIVPWFYFSEALSNATNSLKEYSYLVKKIVFKVSVLPIVKLFSSMFVHIFFILFTVLVMFIYGYSFDWIYFQAIYYSFCMFILLCGISWITSAIMPFFKDLKEIVAIILQVGFWATPIIWSTDILSDTWAKPFKLNPMYYIVEGYRDTFINRVWFFERYNQTLYFWVITFVILIISTFIYKRLRGHFADVL